MSKEQLIGNVFEKSGCNSDTDFLDCFQERSFSVRHLKFILKL